MGSLDLFDFDPNDFRKKGCRFHDIHLKKSINSSGFDIKTGRID
jgi:hypothetical protein